MSRGVTQVSLQDLRYPKGQRSQENPKRGCSGRLLVRSRLGCLTLLLRQKTTGHRSRPICTDSLERLRIGCFVQKSRWRRADGRSVDRRGRLTPASVSTVLLDGALVCQGGPW